MKSIVTALKDGTKIARPESRHLAQGGKGANRWAIPLNHLRDLEDEKLAEPEARQAVLRIVDGVEHRYAWSRTIGDIDAAPVLFNGRLYVGTNASLV
jgi:hypothetical protein